MSLLVAIGWREFDVTRLFMRKLKLTIWICAAALPLSASQLLISDFSNDAVLSYNLSTHVVSTLIPGGDHGLDGPSSLVLGPDGALWITSFYNGQVLRYKPDGSYLSTPIPISDPNVSHPNAVAFSPDGGLLISDQPSDVTNANNRVFFYNAGIVTLLESMGGLEQIRTGPDGDLFALRRGLQVYRYAWNATIHSYGARSLAAAGVPDGQQMAFGPDGALYVSSWLSNKIVRCAAGTVPPPVTQPQLPPTPGCADYITNGLSAPVGLAFLPDGSLVVGDPGSDRVLLYGALPASAPVTIANVDLPFTIEYISDVPEPGSLVLGALGIAALAALAHKRRTGVPA
jgi:hypothetical protein